MEYRGCCSNRRRKPHDHRWARRRSHRWSLYFFLEREIIMRLLLFFWLEKLTYCWPLKRAKIYVAVRVTWVGFLAKDFFGADPFPKFVDGFLLKRPSLKLRIRCGQAEQVFDGLGFLMCRNRGSREEMEDMQACWWPPVKTVKARKMCE